MRAAITAALHPMTIIRDHPHRHHHTAEAALQTALPAMETAAYRALLQWVAALPYPVLPALAEAAAYPARQVAVSVAAAAYPAHRAAVAAVSTEGKPVYVISGS